MKPLTNRTLAWLLAAVGLLLYLSMVGKIIVAGF